MRELEELKQKLRGVPGLRLAEGLPMRDYTTFRVGGPAALMVFPTTEEQARAVVQTAFQCGVTPVFLGRGSDLLVSDRGLDALVVKCELNGIELAGEGLISCQSGVTMARLASFACEQGLTGLEFAHGIPGTVGGGLSMNAGAYGGEMKQVTEETRCLEEDGTILTLRGEEQGFSYRHSAFSDTGRFILSGLFRLEKGDPEEIRRTMDDLMTRRREKQPLEYPSAGSTFKRPEGLFAGALIEQCGLKGFTVGGAQVSEKHAGFVVNLGSATAGDVYGVIEGVKKRVLEQTGVELEPEVKLLGF